MPTLTSAQQKASAYVGLRRYFLTFCTDHRRHLLTKPPVVDLVRAQISRAAAENQFEVIAYCFMPDQVHLLVAGTGESADCKRFIARAKQYSAFYYSRTYSAVLWQRHGADRALADDEVSEVVAREVLETPVRAGMVRRAEDYPFSGWGALSPKP
jgi:putative transposase